MAQLNGKWYTLPADALSSSSGGTGTGTGTTTTGGTSKIDAQQIIAAFGKPGSIVKDAKLDGTEDVGGVKSDHITGTVDIAALVKGLTSAMSSVGSTSTPISPADLQSSVTQLQQYIKGATVDIYVGQSDHFVHKLATKIDGSISTDQRPARASAASTCRSTCRASAPTRRTSARLTTRPRTSSCRATSAACSAVASRPRRRQRG